MTWLSARFIAKVFGSVTAHQELRPQWPRPTVQTTSVTGRALLCVRRGLCPLGGEPDFPKSLGHTPSLLESRVQPEGQPPSPPCHLGVTQGSRREQAGGQAGAGGLQQEAGGALRVVGWRPIPEPDFPKCLVHTLPFLESRVHMTCLAVTRAGWRDRAGHHLVPRQGRQGQDAPHTHPESAISRDPPWLAVRRPRSAPAAHSSPICTWKTLLLGHAAVCFVPHPLVASLHPAH